MSPGAKNMKKEPYAIGTAENEFGSTKNQKMGSGTAEN
jgi:hypothetical protein